jgi:uncharacterized protein
MQLKDNKRPKRSFMKKSNLKLVVIINTLFFVLMTQAVRAVDVSTAHPVQKSDKLIITFEPRPAVSADASVESVMQNLYNTTSEEEYTSAIANIQTLADAGNAEAAFRLAMFFHLESPWLDYKRALALYNMASNKGHAWAINNLGLMYEEGLAVTKDMNRAIELYKMAADKGEARGYMNMARLYFLGKGVERNPALGVEWDEKGGAKGFALAYNELSQVYCCHLYEVPQDLEKSLYYRQKAAELGDTEAQWNVAQRYLEGNGAPQQARYGAATMEKLAAENNSDALNSLGTTYARGRGVTIDKALAVQYWLKAVELGNCLSMMNLAEAYDHGWGVDLDAKKATEYIQQAVQCNSPPAAFDVWKLAKRYQHADGTEQDCAQAVDLYNRAAALGQADAYADLGYIYQNGCGTIQVDTAKAFANYLHGAKLGSAICQNNVASILDDGSESIPRNPVRAYAWLLMAKENTNEAATAHLAYADSALSDEDHIKARAHFTKLKNILSHITAEQLVDEKLY